MVSGSRATGPAISSTSAGVAAGPGRAVPTPRIPAVIRPAGQPRPYVDPGNGRIVVPAMGPYATGKRPWVYQN